MIIVHIGLPKCGSTTLQTFLDSNSEALSALSIDYPRLGRGVRKAHHNLAHELKGRASRFDPQKGGVAEMVSHLRATSHETTIISSESFAPCSAAGVAQFGEALSQVGQPVRVILIVRNLVDIAPSSYNEKVRFGAHTHDFDTFFDHLVLKDKFNAFDYASRWANVFGWEALRVRLLHPKSLVGGDLIDDFLVQAGLDPNSPAMRALSRQPRVNESVGWKTLEAVRALFSGASGLGADHLLVKLANSDLSSAKKMRVGKLAEDVADSMGWRREKGLYMTRAQAMKMQANYEASIHGLNQFVTEKLPEPADLDSSGFVERTFLPDVSHIPADELRSFYDAVASRVLADGSLKAVSRGLARAA